MELSEFSIRHSAFGIWDLVPYQQYFNQFWQNIFSRRGAENAENTF